MEYGIGIDVGGTRIKYSISDRKGNIAYHSSVDTNYQNKDQFLQKLAEIISICLEEASSSSLTVVGIAVAFPGIVEKGVVTGGGDNLPGITPLPIVTFLEDRFHLPAIAMNDALGMAMGEFYFGAAQECSDAIFITIGTGIGGGLIINKKFYNGYKDRGGEPGHIIIERDGLPCSCGNHGCLEAYGSTSALVQHYKKLINDPNFSINGQQLFQKYSTGDTIAKKAFEWHFKNIAIGLGNLTNIFSPELIVLGGGIVNSGPQYIEGIRKYTPHYTMNHLRDSLRIVPAQLGDSAASVGGVGHLFAISGK